LDCSPSGATPSSIAAFLRRVAESMGENEENATFEILKGIQASRADLPAETVTRFGRLEARIGRLDLGLRKDRRNATGMLVMMGETVGDFAARVSEVEKRVAALESRMG